MHESIKNSIISFRTGKGDQIIRLFYEECILYNFLSKTKV